MCTAEKKKLSALAKVGERARKHICIYRREERNTHLQCAKATAFNTPEEK